MKTKGCISILGLVGHTKKEQYIKDNKIKSRFIEKNEDDKAIYYFTDELKDKLPNLKNEKYFNMLPLVIENFKDYMHSCIYTKKSKDIQQNLLNYEKIEFNIEDNGLFISENIGDKEAEYTYFLDALNKLMEDYDSVIVDMTHGFRHFPILAIINMIVQNIKHPEKIEHILFAKEIKQHKEYEIIDLQEYLDLANLSFILINFKDNYTTSNHIKVGSQKYKKLIDCMNKFSSDLMALSLENLLDSSTPNLIDSIEELLNDDLIILKQELKELQEHLENVFKKKSHRFETYYFLAEDLNIKGYVAQALSLLFEGIGFYAKTSFSKYSLKLEESIKKFEEKIIDKKPIKESREKIADYYALTSSCRSYLLYPKNDNRDKLLKEFKDDIYSGLENIDKFATFCEEVGNLRNNLLHSNTGDKIEDIKKEMDTLVKQYKSFCIDENILKNHKRTSNVKATNPTKPNNARSGLRIVKKICH